MATPLELELEALGRLQPQLHDLGSSLKQAAQGARTIFAHAASDLASAINAGGSLLPGR